MKNLVENNVHLYFILFLYAFLLGTGLSYHEFWMDESHHWLVARDSTSLIDLFNNYRYDGHPMLWVFCLWIIGKVTSKIIFVKILQGFISFLIALIFLVKSPFKKRYSILFIFSYYPLFEYGVLSRNYALTTLFLLLFCVFYEKNKALFLPFFLLGLAANSHLFGLIFSVLLAINILYNERLKLKTHSGAIIALLLMLIVAFITIKAPSDHYFYFDVSKGLDIQKLKNLITIWWKAMVPIPNLWNNNFWNSNFFISNYKQLSIVLVLLSWVVPLFVLKKKSGYYSIFYLYAFAIILFSLFTGLHISQRISGFLLFSLVVIVWIEKKTFQENNSIISLNKYVKSTLVYAFFFVQIASAGIFLTADINRPFSNTKNIYDFLLSNVGKDTPIYGGLYCNYIGINNYGTLNLQIISQKNETKCCDWRILNKNKNKSSLDQGIKLMNSKTYKKMILLSPEKIVDFNFSPYNIQLIGQIENSLVKNESAYIYRIKREY